MMITFPFKMAILGCLLCLSTSLALAQDPYKKDILAFQKQDSLQKPVENPILFIGSSSFTNWKDVQDYFPGQPIINRAFGGSTLLNVIHYFDQVVLPYQPKQVVIYCGENDFAASDTLQPETVLERFVTLYQLIRNHSKDVQIAYVSMKPSISRKHLMPKFKEGNRLIEEFLEKDSKASFINTYDAMLDATGYPRADIFVSDSLHMNKKGYEIWQPIIEPHLQTAKTP